MRDMCEVCEIALRSMQRRYPGYIVRKRITEREATWRMQAMQAAIDYFREHQKYDELL